MSTQGTAKAATALPGVMVGAGIMIGQGLIWCGEQFVAQCDRLVAAEEKKFADLASEARAFLLSQRVYVDSSPTTAWIEMMTQLSARRGSNTTQSAPVDQEALRQALKQAYAALADAKQASRAMAAAQENDHKALLLQLTSAIDALRSQLPPIIIARAQRAIDGSTTDIHFAIEMLKVEHEKVMSPEERLSHLREQIKQTASLVKTQVETLDSMLTQVDSTNEPSFINQRNTIHAVLAAAQSKLAEDPEAAQTLMEEAQRLSHVLTEDISAFLLDAWNDIRTQVSKQLGMLKTLKGMVEDARTMKMAQATLLEDVAQRIESAYQEIEEIEQSTSLHVGHRLNLLARRTNYLKEDVFTLVQNYQQQKISTAITTTLGELGFVSVDGEALTAQTNGDIMHVTAMRTEHEEGETRKDKLVTFDVSHSGEISYDFSGYTDKACVQEAERVFEALRLSGIYLFNQQQMHALQEEYPEGIPLRALNRPQYQFHPEMNKVQTELAQRIQSVLEQMKYTHIEQSSIGGSIELEAFNGSIGYRVVLSPEGEVQVFKDSEQLDIATDTHDRLVAEAQHIITAKEQQKQQEQKQKQEALEQQAKESRQKQGYHKQRDKRLLEN